MTIKTIYGFAVFILVSCKSTKSQWLTEEEYYLEAYKKSVLYGCLNESTRGNFQKMLIENDDLCLYTEVQIIYHDTYEKAKSHGSNYARTLEKVSLPDIENKIPGFSQCVSYAFGREVDSIARASYKIYKKG